MVNQSMIDRHEIKAQYYNHQNSPAKIIRDLRRLRDLVKQSKRNGLNTFESNEKQELIDRYDMEHYEAYQLQFLKD